MSLNDDTARCLDATCPDRESCARWLERETGRSRQETFRRGLLPCCDRIAPRAPEPDPDQGDLFGAIYSGRSDAPNPPCSRPR